MSSSDLVTVSSEVCIPLTISTSGIRCPGFQKWVTTVRSGFLVRSAISVGLNPDAVGLKLDERGAVQRITEVLSKSAKGSRLAAEAEGGDAQTKAA